MSTSAEKGKLERTYLLVGKLGVHGRRANQCGPVRCCSGDGSADRLDRPTRVPFAHSAHLGTCSLSSQLTCLPLSQTQQTTSPSPRSAPSPSMSLQRPTLAIQVRPLLILLIYAFFSCFLRLTVSSGAPMGMAPVSHVLFSR